MKLILIIVFILKTIGIVLLSILAILLALILIVLFARLKYDIYFKYDKAINSHVKCKYLFGLFKLELSIKGEEQSFEVWFPFKSYFLKEEIEKIPDEIENDIKTVADNEEELEQKATHTENTYTNTKAEHSTTQSEGKRAKAQKPKKDKKNKKVKNNKARSLIENLQYWKEEYIKYQGTEVLKLVYKLIIDLLKALKPKKFKCEAIIGFDDPSITGMTIGGVSIINAFVPLDINVVGDFENERFEAEAMLVGSVNLFSICVPVIKFIFKKPIWKLIKQYLRGENE